MRNLKQLTCLLSGIIVPCAAAGYAADTLPAPHFAFKAQMPILLDDVGFSATSTFGGPIPTPALDVRAKGGLRYNRLEIGFDTMIEGAQDYPGYKLHLAPERRVHRPRPEAERRYHRGRRRVAQHTSLGV
jgi:hypothetical protein